MQAKRLVIIGPGRVGTTLALWFQQLGHVIAAVAGRKREKAARLAERVGAEVLPAVTAARAGEIVFLTTPDEVVTPLTEEIAGAGGFRPGQYVWHTSGALEAAALAPAAQAGARIGALHPLQTFAASEATLPLLPQTIFTFEGDPQGLAEAETLLAPTGARVLPLAAEAKPLYHTAAVMVSNYVVAMVAVAEKLWRRSGLAPEAALPGLLPLLRGTLTNITTLGTGQALTGPISRGDTATVARHLRALAAQAPAFLLLYRALGRETLALAEENGALLPAQRETLRQLLEGERDKIE